MRIISLIRIALATEENISQVFEIEKEAISPPWSFDSLLDEVSRDDSFFIVAIEGALEGVLEEPSDRTLEETQKSGPSLLGFAILRQVGDDGELLRIAAHKSARRSGVGDLLMGAVFDFAKNNKLLSVFLEVRCSNTAAIRLYEKHGFSALRTRKDYYDNPVENAIVFAKELGE